MVNPSSSYQPSTPSPLPPYHYVIIFPILLFIGASRHSRVKIVHVTSLHSSPYLTGLFVVLPLLPVAMLMYLKARVLVWLLPFCLTTLPSVRLGAEEDLGRSCSGWRCGGRQCAAMPLREFTFTSFSHLMEELQICVKKQSFQVANVGRV
ncbi:hypothetical protein E2542_SST15988 [Spatholobus suberectus]|nr:hypothetical protein E2542_SST15988 [Spatholobus suberectus]